MSGEQRRAILVRTDESEPEAQISGTTWLAILAGLLALAGISLLIATNWEQIGPEVRIAAFRVLLGAIGEGAVRAQSRAVALAVSLEIIWLILPLLGIGLYAQTFQLSGNSIASFLVWLVLTAPLAWRSAHPIVPTRHTGSPVAVLLTGSFFSWGPLYLRGDPGVMAWAL
ncbi:MAG: DUF2157 domain-containing protein [Candidatus Binatia bacterium]|nr:DUF2157 domain-containing protein [Candidatus Binatia bacterium]